MIVGGYDLHLYCKNETLPLVGSDASCLKGFHRYNEFPHEFYGRNEREVMKQARKRGWKFRDGDAICPRCAS